MAAAAVGAVAGPRPRLALRRLARPRLALAAILISAALALTLGPSTAGAQLPPITGYYLHALAGSESSPLSPSGVVDIQRLRLMSRPTWGSARFDLAWETILTLRSAELGLGRGFEGRESAAPWLDLQGRLVDQRRVEWVQGLDRLSISLQPLERTRLTVGRQSVSWATTLFFTPADPFVPFDPADPFREYRAGVDAVRGVFFAGPFSEVEAVVRPAPAPGGGESWTALVRGQHLVRGWEISAWGGLLHDDGAVALATSGSVAELGLRAEGSFRRAAEGTVVRGAAGLERLFEFRERDVRGVVELQYDELGAARPSELLATAASTPAARGELSVLGRSGLVANATWQIHPLTSVSLLSLVNLRDGSTLVSPGLTWSLADEVSLRLGGFAGMGPGPRGTELRSEHGATPLIGFVALTAFF